MIEKLCAVVELQSEIIRVQHDVIHQLGGYDPTEEQTAQADGMSRELLTKGAERNETDGHF